MLVVKEQRQGDGMVLKKVGMQVSTMLKDFN